MFQMRATFSPTFADDRQLIGLARAGEVAAFEPLIGRYHRRVLAALLGWTGQIAVADELAHETFVVAFFELKHLQNEAVFGSWVVGIAFNKYREWLREQKRCATMPADEIPLTCLRDSQETGAIRRAEFHAALFRLIDELPAPYAELLRMRYFDDRSCRDIAAHLGRPLNTVTKQISRAHALLAARLAELPGHTTTVVWWRARRAKA